MERLTRPNGVFERAGQDADRRRLRPLHPSLGVAPCGGARAPGNLRLGDRRGAWWTQALDADPTRCCKGLSDLRFFIAGSLAPIGGGDDGDGDAAASSDGGDLELTPLLTTTEKRQHLGPSSRAFPADEELGIHGSSTIPPRCSDRFTCRATEAQGGPGLLGERAACRPLFPDGANIPGPTPAPPPGLPPGIDLPPQESDEVIQQGGGARRGVRAGRQRHGVCRRRLHQRPGGLPEQPSSAPWR